MASATSIDERLTPTHLIPDTEEGMREEVVEAQAKIDEPEQKKDPRAAKEYSFNLDFKDGCGRNWQGRFVNRILTIHDRQLVGIMRARLTGGMPFDSMDPLVAEINHIVTHLTQSLQDRPSWAKNMLSFTDYELLQAIYEEVDSHESHFRRPQTPEKGSTKKSE